MTDQAPEVEATAPNEPQDSNLSWWRRRPYRWFIEWSLIIALAVTASFLVREYVFQTFSIPSISMLPTLQVGDRIVASKLSIELGTIHTGDIVVFRRPPAEHCSAVIVNDLVKRVIGLPHERLYSIGNVIFINGKALNETWTHLEPLGMPIASPAHPYVVPADNYYMIGDDHALSCDSRYWGPVKRSYIVGKVIFRFWPLSRIAIL